MGQDRLLESHYAIQQAVRLSTEFLMALGEPPITFDGKQEAECILVEV
jgi:hypothetical protein